MTRRSDEAERQHALDANYFKRVAHQFRIDTRSLHVAQVAKQSESAEAVLDQHGLPHFTLLLASRQPYLPRLRRGQRSLDKLTPCERLIRRQRLGMRQKEHITQFHRACTVVLCKSVGIEPRKGGSQSLFHLCGKRLTAILPVNGKEFGQLVRALNDTRQRLSHKSAMSGIASHLSHQQQRRVTQLHLLACFDRKRSHLSRVYLRNKSGDALGDGRAILIELVLPQHAGQHRAPQLRVRTDHNSGCALVRTQGRSAESELTKFQNIQAHSAPPFKMLCDCCPVRSRHLVKAGTGSDDMTTHCLPHTCQR